MIKLIDIINEQANEEVLLQKAIDYLTGKHFKFSTASLYGDGTAFFDLTVTWVKTEEGLIHLYYDCHEVTCKARDNHKNVYKEVPKSLVNYVWTYFKEMFMTYFKLNVRHTLRIHENSLG